MMGLFVLVVVVVCMMVAWEGFKIGGKAQYSHQWKYLALGMFMVLGSAATAFGVTMYLLINSK